MNLIYPAVFHHTEGEGYWVNFPDFAGGTEGKTLEEAVRMAEECLAELAAVYIEDEIQLPDPTDIRTIKLESEGFSTLIHFDPSPYVRKGKTIRKNVTVPEWLAKRAEKAQINFSETLTEALMEKIQF